MECLLIGVATPWDDCPYGKSNANTFVRARAYRVFPDLVCRDQPRGHPSGPAAPSGCPLGWSLHTRSKNPIRTRLPQVLLQCDGNWVLFLYKEVCILYITLDQTSHWHEGKIWVLVYAPYNKTQLLFSCQWEVWSRVICHPAHVQVDIC